MKAPNAGNTTEGHALAPATTGGRGGPETGLVRGLRWPHAVRAFPWHCGRDRPSRQFSRAPPARGALSEPLMGQAHHTLDLHRSHHLLPFRLTDHENHRSPSSCGRSLRNRSVPCCAFSATIPSTVLGCRVLPSLLCSIRGDRSRNTESPIRLPGHSTDHARHTRTRRNSGSKPVTQLRFL